MVSLDQRVGGDFLISAGVVVLTMLVTTAFCLWAPDKYADLKAALPDSIFSLGLVAGGITFLVRGAFVNADVE